MCIRDRSRQEEGSVARTKGLPRCRARSMRARSAEQHSRRWQQWPPTERGCTATKGHYGRTSTTRAA
eukprot:2198215-Lingulodinium_polyedra.AAC.1